VLTAAALQTWMPWAPALLLAGVRWLGCLMWMPGLAPAGVTIRMRVALAVLLSIVMLPAISNGSSDRIFAATAVEWPGLAIGELAVGTVLGLGVRILFMALALAGELLDRQAGLAVRQVFDPGGDEDSGPIGVTLAWLGAAAVLLATPRGGPFPLVNTMLGQFVVIPLGSVAGAPGSDLLIVLVQQSLCLAIEVAAPLLATMSLITLASGWLGRSAPRLRVDSLVTPVRVAVCLAILATTTPAVHRLLDGRIEAVFNVGPRLLEHSARGQ
jgi:flagellar biosynthetic protein FliR